MIAAKLLSSCQRRSGHSRFGQRVNTAPSAFTVGVPQNGHSAGGRGGGERSGRSTACGAGESTCGITSPARRTITSSPGRTSLRARSSSLWSVATLDGDAADVDRLELGERVQVAELADVPVDVVQRGDRGGGRELPGDRPARIAADDAEPALELRVVDLDHHAVDLEVQPAAPLLPGEALGDDLVLGVEPLDVVVDAEAVVAQPLQRLPVDLEAEPLGGADAVAPHAQRPLGGERRVELADRAGRRVARVHERRQAGLGAPLVERGEVGQRHVDLAADLHQRRRVLDPQRDRGDRAQVVRDVLADLAVAAGGAALQHAVAVDQRDRQPVDLRLGDVAELGVLDPLARQVGAHPLHPGAQLLLRARVGEREHRLEVARPSGAG